MNFNTHKRQPVIAVRRIFNRNNTCNTIMVELLDGTNLTVSQNINLRLVEILTES